MAKGIRTHIIVDQQLKADCEAEGKREGVGWTTMLKILARRGLRMGEDKK